jgi:hypothetical protein
MLQWWAQTKRIRVKTLRIVLTPGDRSEVLAVLIKHIATNSSGGVEAVIHTFLTSETSRSGIASDAHQEFFHLGGGGAVTLRLYIIYVWF